MQEFRKTQPATHDIDSMKWIEPERFILDNGIPVYAIQAGSEDILKLDLVFNAGSFYQTQPLLASLTNKCLQEGTKSYSSKEIAEKVDFYGAHLRICREQGRLKAVAVLSRQTFLKSLYP